MKKETQQKLIALEKELEKENEAVMLSALTDIVEKYYKKDKVKMMGAMTIANFGIIEFGEKK